MGEEQVRVDPNEDLDSLIARLKQTRSKDVVLLLPNNTRALQTLENFYALRTAAREQGLRLTFGGGSKTQKGLAKILGFRVMDADGDDGGVADFATGGITDQFTTPPTQPSQTQPQRTAAFDNPPSGFVVQPNTNGAAVNGSIPRNGTGRGEAIPPAPPTAQPRTPQDFFDDIPDMNIPSIQPPPMRPGGMDFGNGDTVLTRNNAASIFDDVPASAPPAQPTTRPPAAPTPGFDFSGGGSGEGRTMSYDEAMQSGLFANEPTNLSSEFEFNANPQTPIVDEDDVPAVPPVGGDTAADRFRRPGVRREDELDEAPRGRRNARTSRPAARRGGGGVRAVAMPAPLAGLGTRVNKILNPVPRTSGGGMGMRSELSPEEKVRRQRQSRRTTFLAFLVIALLVIAVVAIIVLSLGQNNPAAGPGGNGGVVAATRLNLVYKTQPVSNNVTLLLDTSSTGGVSGTSGQSNPASSGAAASSTGTGGRLPVTQISATSFTAKGDYPAFGSRMQPTGTAQGTVNFTNGAAAAVSYGAGAVIYTNRATGVTYRLQNAVSIPAANLFAGSPGRANGVVVADRAGSAGNLPTGFSGYLNNNTLLVQIGAVAGGTEQPVKVVSKEDVEALRKQLIDKAQTDAQASLKDKYNPATQDIQVIPSGDPSCQFTKNAGDVADTFSGSCSVNPQAYIYNKADLQKAVQDQLVTDPKLKVDPNTIKISNVGQVAPENGRLKMQVTVAGQTYSPVDLDKFKNEVAGKTIAEVQTLINSNYPQIDRIDLSNISGDKLPDASKIDIATTPGDATATTPTSGSPAAGSTTAASGTTAATTPAANGSPAPAGTPGP